MSNKDGELVTDYAWLDLSSGTVSFSVSERVTITLPLEEFSDFLTITQSIAETLKSTPGVTLGTYEVDGVTYEQFMLTPEEDDFN
tara:strand:- start:178 stop:432 length:255 start_codon:yes stop_codon:yes gene_type:complete